jgi:hypothetical protein
MAGGGSTWNSTKKYFGGLKQRISNKMSGVAKFQKIYRDGGISKDSTNPLIELRYFIANTPVLSECTGYMSIKDEDIIQNNETYNSFLSSALHNKLYMNKKLAFIHKEDNQLHIRSFVTGTGLNENRVITENTNIGPIRIFVYLIKNKSQISPAINSGYMKPEAPSATIFNTLPNDSGTMLNLENDIKKHINRLQEIIASLYKQYNIFFVTHNTPLDYIPNNANVNILPIIIHSVVYGLFIENIEKALPNNVGLYLVDYMYDNSILKYVHKQNGKLIQVELERPTYFDYTYEKHKQIINHEFIKKIIEKNKKLNLQIDYIIGRRVNMTS